MHLAEKRMTRLSERFNFLRGLSREPIGAALLGLAGDSTVYLAGGLLVGLGSVILIPLYTRYLTLREFGVYALIDVLVLLVVAVSCLKMDVSYLKWFADIDSSKRGELLGSTVLTGLTASLAGGAIISLFAASRQGELWLQAPVRNYAWLLLPIVVLENLQVLFLTDLRAHRKSALYSMAALLRVMGMIIASYYLIAIRQKGLPGLFLGRLIADASSVAFLAAICLRPVVWKFSRSLLGPMLRFGAPLIWCVFAVMLQDASGRYFLTHYGTLEQVGLLGAAIKISAVFQMLVNVPFGVAWGGMMFQIVKQRDAQIIYSKILGYVFALALGMALVLTIFAPTLFRVFTAPAYYGGIAILPLVLLVRAMNVVEQPSAIGIYLSGRTGIFAAIYTIALAGNLLFLALLVPRWGALGATSAWLLSSATVPVSMFIMGQRFYRLSLSGKLLLFPLLPWMFVFFRPFASSWHLTAPPLWLQVAGGGFVALSIVALLAHDFRGVRRRFLIGELSK
jgi:O-antigen/teichoic acid export membrane protein